MAAVKIDKFSNILNMFYEGHVPNSVVLKLFIESIILIQMKIQSIKKLNFEKKVQKIC